ncbi:MAG TPA: hypothetical protein VNH17_02350 [Streptosporangiaceae bacterium]|nr:hypothetical protein [Streptosporangiaceae bacterium]
MTRDEIQLYLRPLLPKTELADHAVAFEAFVREWSDMQITIGDPFAFVAIAWDWFKFGWYARASHDGYS